MNVHRKSVKSRTSSCDQSENQRPIEKSVHDREVIVNVDDGERGDNLIQDNNPFAAVAGDQSSTIWRESSYDFWKGGNVDNGFEEGRDESTFSFQSPTKKEMLEISEDPPSRLISSFLQMQKTTGAEISLDMDLEMDELKKPKTSTGTPSYKDQRVSFHEPPSHKSHAESYNDEDSDGCIEGPKLCRKSMASIPHAKESYDVAEVLQCTSNSYFCVNKSLLREKTKSRLMDPPQSTFVHSVGEEKKSTRIPNRSGKAFLRSGQMPQRSGFLGKSVVFEEDDDDPFEDIHEEFKSSNISIWTILELIGFFIAIAVLMCSLFIPKLESQTVLGLHLWKWVVFVLVLISGRLLSGWSIRIIVFFVERNFLFRKRFLYFVYGVRKAVQNCIWLGLALLAWHFLFDKKIAGENKALLYVTKILFCLIVATVFRLIKTLLLKVLASSFHVSTYFDRIQDALINQYIIEALSGPPVAEIQHNRKEDDKLIYEMQKLQNAGATLPNDLKAAAMSWKNERVIGGSSANGHGGTGLKSSQIGKSIKLPASVSWKDFNKQQMMQEGGITINFLHNLNQKNITAWNMKKLTRMVRYGALTTLDEQINQGIEDDESTAIMSEHEAKVAARKIFYNVAKPGARHIYFVDVLRFMREDEAVKTMSLICETHSDGVTKKTLKNWVVNAFRERRALSLTLNDTKTAVNKLHQIANVIVAAIVFAIWLLILNIATTHFFVLFSSQILLLVFVFGNTIKMTFEAMIFLFIMHPLDVGDRCEVNGVQMIVEEMNILTTVFLRYDNMNIAYPNSILATLPICNYYRSPDMGDSVDFNVHFSTPMEKIIIVKEKITLFMEKKKDHWHPGAQLVVKDLEGMDKIKISICMRHRINFQDMGLKSNRRELVVIELIRVLKSLDIEYSMLPGNINIQNIPQLSFDRLPSTSN